MDVLAVASLGTCFAAAAALQIYSAKTKHIIIVMYITMPIPLRVIISEMSLLSLLVNVMYSSRIKQILISFKIIITSNF